MRAPFTVRLDPRLVATARARARDESRGVAEVVEAALRLYLARTAADVERAALVNEVEQALVERLDRRLGRAVEGLRDIAAKANFDQSLILCLVHETLGVLFERDQTTFNTIVNRARKRAAERLRRAELIDPDVSATAIGDLKKEVERLKGAVAERDNTILALQKSQAAQEGESRYWESVATWEKGRVPWALQRFHNQSRGAFAKRLPLEAFLEQYDAEVPQPAKGASA